MSRSEFRYMRVEHHTVNCPKIVNEVLAGKIVPAAFQRPYSWSKKNVTDMVRSADSGAPLGNIMTWYATRKMDMSNFMAKRFGPNIVVPKSDTNEILLNGFNRLATMAWLMFADAPKDMLIQRLGSLFHNISEKEKSIFLSGERLVFDAENGEFYFVNDAEADKGLRMSFKAAVSKNINLLKEVIESKAAQGIPQTDIDVLITNWDDLRRSNSFYSSMFLQTNVYSSEFEYAREFFLNTVNRGSPLTDMQIENIKTWKPDDLRNNLNIEGMAP